MQKRFIVSLLLLVLIGLVAGCKSTYVYDSITREGKIVPAATLFVETYNGNVSVVPTQSKDIEVEIEKWATGDQKQVISDFLLGDEITTTGVTENGVSKIIASRVHPEQPNPTGITNFGVNLKIKIPTSIVKDVEIVTSNGAVHVEGVTGSVSATSSNAAVDFSRVKGDMVVRTSQGAVGMVDIEGNLDIATSNGTVKVRTAKVLKEVKIATSAGKIDYRSHFDAAGHYSLETSNSPIDFRVPAMSKLSFYVLTNNGTITSELPITDVNPDANILEGNLNEGGAVVNLTTSNGDITIYQDGE